MNPPSPTRATFVVRAGIVPGMATIEKSWELTAAEWGEDERAGGSEPGLHRFIEKLGAMHTWVQMFADPERYNWVETAWIWY